MSEKKSEDKTVPSTAKKTKTAPATRTTVGFGMGLRRNFDTPLSSTYDITISILLTTNESSFF